MSQQPDYRNYVLKTRGYASDPTRLRLGDSVVLSDTREPRVLHTDGAYQLSSELLSAGTVPQVAARRCSEKFKGWVIDSWLERELAGEPFRQVMGFNADEPERIARDLCYGGDNRYAEHPLMEWGMGRLECERYLLSAFGRPWPKSCCWFCPFAAGKPPVLARYRALPHRAAEALFIEHISLALNPNMTLYSSKSLLSCLADDENVEAYRLFREKLDSCQWALYRVRRVYLAKGRADRAVERVLIGTKTETLQALLDLGLPTEHTVGSLRAYVRRREQGVYPTAEEMFVAAPAVVQAKSKPSFEQHWQGLALSCASTRPF